MPSFRYKKDFYKVLGKISPEAVWIGEGETFEGDEYSEEGVKYNKTGNMLGQEHNESFYYLIRCPVCKSFH